MYCFFINVASYSHRVSTYTLADSLAKGGHKVSFMSPFKNRGGYVNPNITDIVPAKVEKVMYDGIFAGFDINRRINKTFDRVEFALYPLGIDSCQAYFDSPELQQFYRENVKLDLVIMDNCMADCGAVIAYKYNAKLIIFSTVTHLGNEFDLYGYAPESSAVPEYEINPSVPPMSFLNRVYNALVSIHFRWEHYKCISKLDAMARQHLKDPSMPFLDDIVRNTSLVLYTGGLVTDYTRSHAPLIVDVAGIYCSQNDGKLSPELLSFLDDEPHSDGIVYISLGTLAISSNLPGKTKQIFFNSMKKFPKLRFVWKWDGPHPKNKPENVFLAKWVPQTELLAHPNIKAFVTQCGRPSTVEALCHAVPMIALPVLGDQDNNANRMNLMGANVKLELRTLTEPQLQDAINTAVYNKSMKARLQRLRDILLDKPVSDVDTALWWVDYVLRHNDTSHLRPAGFSQWWFQRRLLDVWAFIYTIILGFIVCLIYLTIFIRKMLTRSMFQVKKKTQ